MKTTIVFFTFIISSFCLFAQEKNPCDKNYSIAGSMALGGGNKGDVMHLELGLWGRKNHLGVFAGMMFYDGATAINPKTNTSSIPLIKELYIRPILKLDHKIMVEGFHHAISMFAGSKGNAGCSYRLYYVWGGNFMIGLEPFVSIRSGNGLMVITTFAF